MEVQDNENVSTFAGDECDQRSQSGAGSYSSPSCNMESMNSKRLKFSHDEIRNQVNDLKSMGYIN